MLKSKNKSLIVTCITCISLNISNTKGRNILLCILKEIAKQKDITQAQKALFALFKVKNRATTEHNFVIIVLSRYRHFLVANMRLWVRAIFMDNVIHSRLWTFDGFKYISILFICIQISVFKWLCTMNTSWTFKCKWYYR